MNPMPNSTTTNVRSTAEQSRPEDDSFGNMSASVDIQVTRLPSDSDSNGDVMLLVEMRCSYIRAMRTAESYQTNVT